MPQVTTVIGDALATEWDGGVALVSLKTMGDGRAHWQKPTKR